MLQRGRLNQAFMSTVLYTSCVLGFTVGCAVVDVVGPEHLNGHQFASGAKPLAHIYADNWGWYLFKYIPIVTGNLDDPGSPRLPKFFTDNVRVDLLVDKITEEGQKMGASVVTDLRVRDRSSYQPLTLFFWLNEYEVSANLSRLESEGDLPKSNQNKK